MNKQLLRKALAHAGTPRNLLLIAASLIVLSGLLITGKTAFGHQNLNLKPNYPCCGGGGGGAVTNSFQSADGVFFGFIQLTLQSDGSYVVQADCVMNELLPWPDFQDAPGVPAEPLDYNLGCDVGHDPQTSGILPVYSYYPPDTTPLYYGVSYSNPIVYEGPFSGGGVTLAQNQTQPNIWCVATDFTSDIYALDSSNNIEKYSTADSSDIACVNSQDLTPTPTSGVPTNTPAPGSTPTPTATLPPPTPTPTPPPPPAPPLATFSGHEVYVVGANHHLYQYHYSSGANWGITDISAAANSTSVQLTGAPTSYSFNGTDFAFALTVPSGHLEEFRNAGSGWSATDINATFGVSTTFAGSPTGYGYTDPNTGAIHDSVLLVGTNGQLYDFAYTSATNWKLLAVSGSPGSGVTFAGTPSGYAVTPATGAFELAYVVASNGGVYEYGDSNGSWTHLNTFTSLASGVTASGSPSAYWYSVNGIVYHKLFVEGKNGHLYVLNYSPDTNWGTPLDISDGVTLTGSPQAHFSAQSTPPLHFVYATDSNGNLEEFYNCDQCSQTWQRVNLGTGNTGHAVTGTPWSYSYYVAGTGTLTHIIFYLESDANLHEAYYNNVDGWRFQNLGVPSGTTVASSPNGHGV